MENYIMFLLGACGLANGVVVVVRPDWFKRLWKIRTSYEYWGSKSSNLYYNLLGTLIIGVSCWVIVKFGYLIWLSIGVH